MMKQPAVLKNSNRAWGASPLRYAVLIPSLAVCLSSFPAYAETNGGTQKLIYEVYAGGINAVQAEMTIYTSAANKYETKFTAKTQGFLAKLAPWSGSFFSKGWRMAETEFHPELHKSEAIWKGEEEIKEYKYKKDRSFIGLFIKEHNQPMKQETVEDELTQGTTDILSASMEVFQNISAGENCTGTSEVFDGRRRFELIFNHVAKGEMQSSDYNIYSGPAVECTIEIKPIAGKWHEKPRGWLSIQEQGRAKGTMPTIWLAKISDDLPAVPVKIRVKTDYGALFMHLVTYEGAGKTIIADSRK